VTRLQVFEHRFVDRIPADIESGVLYITIGYATAVHSCACGCGGRVVTPFTPTDWELRFDGEAVSLSPSIGNWSFSCQSHYWIKRNRVEWAPRWSAAQITRARELARDARASSVDAPVAPVSAGDARWSSFLQRLGQLARSFRR
jgi:hypothetical protein